MSRPTISQPKCYLSLLFSILLFLFSCVNRVSAQAPEGISYQAIARGTDGLPLADTDVIVEFRIRSGSVNGTVEYAERHSVETNKFGLFTLSIGKGTVLSGSFGSITWATGDKFLQVDIDGTLSGTTQMLSVPYALYAAKAKESQTLSITGNKLSISDGNEVPLPSGPEMSNLSELNDVNITGLQPNQILKWDGTKWVAGTDAGITGNANGDVTGPYTALNVARIQNQPVSNTLPTNGQVLQWDGSEWKASSSGATTLDGLDVNAATPSNGQVLQWNATTNAWVPATPSGGTSYTAGTGINIGTNNVITNEGDLSSTNEFQTLAFNAANNTLSISPSGNSITLPVSGGASTLDGLTDVNAPTPLTGQVLQWDGTVWKPTTLSGSGGATTLDGLNDVNAPTPSVGQILQWNGTAWIPVTSSGGTQYTAGAGVTIDVSNNIINTGDLDVTNEIQAISLANGNELTLSKNGGTVILPTSTYTAGTGINLNGNTILNTGDTNAADDITTNTTASGDLSGNFPSPTVSRLQGRTVSTAAPQNGQVLKYNSTTTQWEPATDQGQPAYTSGAGINIQNNQIENTGDLSNTNEIQTLSFNTNNNELSISGAGGNTVTLPTAPTYIPEIAVYIEVTRPPAPSASNSWTQRLLANPAVLPSIFVSLNGSNLVFSQTGKYLISASAPAIGASRHKICLRESGTSVTKIAGSSEDTPAFFDVNGSNKTICTRSFLIGILEVNTSNIATQYSLDHWVESNSQGVNAFGLSSNIPGVQEVYSQIRIEKIE